MTDKLIPEDVRAFILRYIDSVAQLEALLLLRANPTERWDSVKVARRLYTSEPEITEVLARLRTDGFFNCEANMYRYDCGPEQQRQVDRLAEVYSRHLISVSNLIHAKPRRIREFANAFKFRKDC